MSTPAAVRRVNPMAVMRGIIIAMVVYCAEKLYNYLFP